MIDRPTSPPTRDEYVHMVNLGLDTVGRGVLLIDATGRILALNAYAARTLGIERPLRASDDLRLEDGFPVLVDLSGRELAPSERPALGVLDDGSVHESTVLGLLRDDSDQPLWLEVSASPLLDAEGQLWGVLETFVDADRRIETHGRLHELSSIAEATDNGVVVTDLDRKVLWSNPAFTRMTGYTAEEAKGRKPGDLLQCEETDAETIERMRRSLDAGEGFHEELLNVMKDGRKRWIDLEVQPLYDALGHHTRWMGVKRDITERVDIDARMRAMTHRARADAEALQLALERAERLTHQAQAATRAKDEFLRNTGHEIRTPLNGVLTAASALRESLRDREQIELLQIVQDSGERLLRLLDNVLQYANIAAGDLTVRPRPFALDGLVRGMESLYRPLAASRGVELQVEVSPPDLPMVEGDTGLLQRLLSLLLDNAVDAARAHMTLRAVARRRGRSWNVRFEVCDDGSGVAPEDVERIFEPFRQRDGSASRDRQGLGLGLAIVRGLVERMGGRLTLDSGPDQHTCFAVEFCLTASAAAPPFDGSADDELDDALACVREARPRVLLVEDPDHPLTVLFRTLTLLGARVEIVAGGSFHPHRIEGRRVDVVIVDESVASSPEFASSALGVADDVDLVLRSSNGTAGSPPAGFRAVLREPVDLESLAGVLTAV